MKSKRPGFIQFTDLELKEKLQKFCKQTNRETAPTLRAILRLFLEDGDEASEYRLTRGLWEVSPAEVERARVGKRLFDEAAKEARKGTRHRKKKGAG